MGQATVDLPDPMQPAPMTAMSPDDLLAQLAGDEIDRLLAEVESETPPDEQPVRAPIIPLPSFSDPPTPESGAAPAEPAGLSTQAAEVDAAVNAQLDDLFAQLALEGPEIPGALSTADGPAPTVPQLPEMPGDASPAAAVAARDVDSTESEPSAAATDSELAARAAADTDGDTSAAERNALADTQMNEVAAEIQAELIAAPSLPAYLRPLEWLNAPLAAFPDPVRDLVGKIAILTTANAVSILVYVFFFRRHG